MTQKQIQDWHPEEPAFWKKTGKKIAMRNLIFSIFAEFLAFSIWQVWSAVAVNLPSIGFQFSVDQLFWLAALPGLTGATLRIPYSLMVPIIGGRNWTLVSTALLLIPAVGIGLAVQNPATPYLSFVILALLCGFGGGNFASSMANINYFFPKKMKGLALGLNAAGGNIGVSIVQFTVPFVIAASIFGQWAGGAQTWVKGTIVKQVFLQNAAFIWVPFIILALFTTWFFMNNLKVAKASLNDQIPVFKHKHSWLMSWLYLGTFGSFIGYAAGFPMLIKSQFPAIDPLQYAFLGPLVGSIIRPMGGWLSDHLGGAKVTLWNFVAMIAAVLGVVYFLQHKTDPSAFVGFFVMFMILFVCAGIGNGSTYRMIPVIFLTLHQRKAKMHGTAHLEITKLANKEAGVAIGLTSAVAAYGAFFIPKSYGTSISITGGPEAALMGFAIFYISCVLLTWWFYFRKNAEVQC